MGARLSSGTPQPDGMTAAPAPLPRHQHGGSPSHPGLSGSRGAQGGPSGGPRTRPRSIGSVEVFRDQDPASSHRTRRRDSNPRDSLGSSDSDDEPPQRSRHRQVRRHQLPPSIPISFYRADIKCPVCNKMVPQDEIEIHLIMCLNKPRVNYNEDVLTEDKGECAICLDDLEQGDTIARLPCLCIYHKNCIDEWFKRSRTCPEHPGEE